MIQAAPWTPMPADLLRRLTMLLRLCSTVSPRICSCSQQVISSDKSDRFLVFPPRTCDEGSAQQILFQYSYISSGNHFGPSLFPSFPSFACLVWYQVASSAQYIAFIYLCTVTLLDTQHLRSEHYFSHLYIPLYFLKSKP